MAKTKRGIYHNLKESEYATSNSEVAFFFSSLFYLGKFMDEYTEHRAEFRTRIARVIETDDMNTDFLADIHLYREVEKRGFRVVDENLDVGEDEIEWTSLHLSALQKMTEKNTLEWSRTHVQK